jgi:hypothetical protein
MRQLSLSPCVIVAGILALATPAIASPSLNEKQQEEARNLVKQLGDPSYKVRDLASAKLVRMGSGVEAILREGMKCPDPEIRFRCRTILPLALTYELERRLQVFLAGKETADIPAPALWPKFKELVGDSQQSRELFADMHRFDTSLLTSLESNPAGQEERLSERCLEFMTSQSNGTNMIARQDEIALLLFAGVLPKSRVGYQAQSYLFNGLQIMSYKPRGKDLLKNNPLIRKLLVNYISEGNNISGYGGLYLIANLELKEGVDIAKKYLKQPSRDTSSRAMAVSILGKLGGKAAIADIVPFLEDKTSIQQMQFGNGAKINTQMRDVALATLVQATGQNLNDYNFAYLKVFGGRGVGPSLYLNPMLSGFGDDQTRDASLKKWNDWYAGHKDSLNK